MSYLIRWSILLGMAVVLVAVTRLPLMPSHLYSFDSVNLALAMEEFDPTRNQPQPPGYPLFVAEAKLFKPLFETPETTFRFLTILICGLSLGLLYLLGQRMFSTAVGLTAAALLFVNPVFWFSGLTSPLRPHLALVSIAVAYCCWRTAAGQDRFFYAASLALGLGSGFRPELLLVLLPLWGWTAWYCTRPRVLWIGCLLLGATSFSWLLALALASGGWERLVPFFYQYFVTESRQTSLLVDPRAGSWVRWAGRAILWNVMGALPWIWTLPLGWSQRSQWPDWKRRVGFLAAWFLPSFAFNFLVHIGDPDQALGSISALCLLGGYCLVEADGAIGRRWNSEIGARGLITWLALGANLLLFFAEFPLPQRQPATVFRGLASVSDAVRIGTYESSYARVRWVEQMMNLALQQIRYLKENTQRPVVLIWTRNGEPIWRKLCYYLPEDKLYVLEEAGETGVAASRARLWVRNQTLARYSGDAPIAIPVPPGARMIWILAGGKERELAQSVPLVSAPPVYYADLPADSFAFRWGSFEFVPEALQVNFSRDQ